MIRAREASDGGVTSAINAAEGASSSPSGKTAVASPTARSNEDYGELTNVKVGDGRAVFVSELTANPVTLAVGDEASWVSGILRGCRGPSERAARALDLLIVGTAGAGGYLYLMRDGALSLVAPIHGEEPPDALAVSLRQMFRDARHGESYPPPSEPPSPMEGDEASAPHRRILLMIERNGRRTAVGAAAIFGGASTGTSPSARLVHQVAHELHDAGDVSVGSDMSV